MAEFLSAGIFIEEVPSQIQVVQGVSTSNGAFVGYTERGPVDTATLVTSWDQYVSVFGDIVADSYMGYCVAAFFSNGGRRAYIVRVLPSDATSADAKIDSVTTDQYVQTGDGSATTITEILPQAENSSLKVNAGASPIVPGSVTAEWVTAGTPVPAAAVMQRNGTTPLAGDAALNFFEGRVDPAELPTPRPGLWSIDPDVGGGTGLVLTYTETGAITITFDTIVGNIITNSVTTDGVATLDLETGFLSLDTTNHGTPPDAVAMTIAVVPTVPASATDDGLGAWTLPNADISGAGAISYAAGTYSLLPVTAPIDLGKILFSYSINAWDMDPVSGGAWGADVRVRVSGNLDSFTGSTGQYSKFDVDVLLKDSTGTYRVEESYEELVFDDATDAMYFADVLNDMSDLVTVVEPAGDEAPGQLLAIPRWQVIAGGGDGTTTGIGIVAAILANAPIQPRTVSITYVEATGGTTRTITDDGAGNLIGSVDGVGNTINYTSGAIAFTVASGDTIKAGTLVTASYYEVPAETLHTEDFTGGTNGTFDATNYGRNQFTSPTLVAGSTGMFALNKVEDILNLCLPDFAWDTIITGDILDYVDGRESQPRGRDRWAILAGPRGYDAQEVSDWFRFDIGRFSKSAAIYWPHIKLSDPLANNRDKIVPPMGHVAGIYARTDSIKNVAKAPGGTVDGALRFLTGLEFDTTQGDRDLVYQNKINPLIAGPQTGLAVWGVRTTSNESEWRYINVSRLFMFLGNSIFNATHWIVFENNGPALWTRIHMQVSSFLNNLFREGYFAGNNPNEAFVVKVDATNNPASVVDAGQVIIDIAVAPQKPAEFVRFRLTQKAL